MFVITEFVITEFDCITWKCITQFWQKILILYLDMESAIRKIWWCLITYCVNVIQRHDHYLIHENVNYLLDFSWLILHYISWRSNPLSQTQTAVRATLLFLKRKKSSGGPWLKIIRKKNFKLILMLTLSIF